MKHAGRIVVADDDADDLDVVRGILAEDGHAVFQARAGTEALDLMRRVAPDLVMASVGLPGLSGIELCRILKGDPSTRLVPVMLMTGWADTRDRIEGIDAGADDFLAKPINAHELRARVSSLVRLKRFTDDLDSADSIILSLALTVEARDRYTSGHCQRMAAYGSAFGSDLGLDAEEIAALGRGGYLHDVGKVGIPDAILWKQGPLTSDEFTIVKRHTTIGESLCGNLRLLRLVRPIVRHHHERLDGSGYPDGRSGNDIPLLAQIMGIVDVYDALTSDRPYRSAFTPEAACAELEHEARLGWRHAHLVSAFTELCRSGQLDNLATPGMGPSPFADVPPA
jgi:putative two-component system response regulator